MNNSLKSVTSTAKSILVLLPTDPTFDEVASATSLYLSLKKDEGKEVNIYCPTPMIVEFNRLVGVNKIKNEIGNKNLAISFSNYNPQGIEKVSWDIDNGQFKLTIVPKVNVIPPAQDQVIVGYSGVAADLVILVGGRDEASFPILKTDELANVALAHIGISQVNINGRTLSSYAAASSTVSEITANLIKTDGQLEADLATNLLMGIEEGTNQFSTNTVTADTFALVSELMRAGGKRTVGQNQVSASDFPAGSVPTTGNVPSSWTEPKIFKGTSVS